MKAWIKPQVAIPVLISIGGALIAVGGAKADAEANKKDVISLKEIAAKQQEQINRANSNIDSLVNTMKDMKIERRKDFDTLFQIIRDNTPAR